MTVDELIKDLTNFSTWGHGDLPVCTTLFDKMQKDYVDEFSNVSLDLEDSKNQFVMLY